MSRPATIRLFRYLSLLGILTLGAVLLWPAREAPAVAGAAPVRSLSVERKHVLRITAGQNYLPGSVPQGIGQPLQGLTRVVADFEARFPDTKVEVIAVPQEREFLVTQLSGGSAPDIVAVNVEDVWVDVQKEWYVPSTGISRRRIPLSWRRATRQPRARDNGGTCSATRRSPGARRRPTAATTV